MVRLPTLFQLPGPGHVPKNDGKLQDRRNIGQLRGVAGQRDKILVQEAAGIVLAVIQEDEMMIFIRLSMSRYYHYRQLTICFTQLYKPYMPITMPTVFIAPYSKNLDVLDRFVT